jgi:hypothetical protein
VEANLITLWEATAVDGTELNSLQHETFERVNERGGARSLRVFVDSATVPVHASCVPERGESLHLFTRRGIIGVASPDQKRVNMPVIELRTNGTLSSRLYLHPEHGAIFSTQDLNL